MDYEVYNTLLPRTDPVATVLDAPYDKLISSGFVTI